MKRIAIIGGGAAGLAASIAAAEALRQACGRSHADGTEVVIFERDERVGRSILATGNGRCNFSNAHPDACLYHSAEFVAEALAALEQVVWPWQGSASAIGATATSSASGAGNAVLDFFAYVGLVWREESEGRLYPQANKASVVLDVLRATAHVLGVREACNHCAVRIDAPSKEEHRYHIRFADGTVEHVDALVLACGGALAQLLPQSVRVRPLRPVLGPLATDGCVKRLDNVRVRCSIQLLDPSGTQKAEETGELLFRKYGVSGIAVFNLSRIAQRGDSLYVNLLPQLSAKECASWLTRRACALRDAFGTLTTEGLLRGLLLPQVTDALLHELGIPGDSPLDESSIGRIACLCTSFELTVRGIGDERQCQVHRGGVHVGQLDAHTMELRGLPGFHVAGEALDVDGPCGGYNLHWAWASGLLAGCHAAQCAFGESL